MQCRGLYETTNSTRFSWDTVPTFAFPGAHDGFLSASEIKKYNLTAFNHFMIWGFNVSCQAKNGTIYPADVTTKQSYYSCGPDNLFYPNLEQSLSYQAQQIRENILNQKNGTNTTTKINQANQKKHPRGTMKILRECKQTIVPVTVLNKVD